MKTMTVLAIGVGAALLCAAPISLHGSSLKSISIAIDKAEARLGRPLTPGSVAGVHRRVERRAYRRGYYYGAGAAGGYYQCPYPPCY